MEGEVKIAGQEISATSFINFEKEGDKVTLHAKDKAAHFLFLSGTPHNEPIVHGGPFVMTTNRQMQETQQRLHRGEMGVLNPL